MSFFNYEALDSHANELTGTIEAKNSREAISQIRNMDLFPTKVRAVTDKNELLRLTGERKVSKTEKIIEKIIGRFI